MRMLRVVMRGYSSRYGMMTWSVWIQNMRILITYHSRAVQVLSSLRSSNARMIYQLATKLEKRFLIDLEGK